MMHKKIVSQKTKEFEIQEYISQNLRGAGHSFTKLQMTPLGEKIIITASRPGLIVGRKGQNIKKMTSTLKKKFALENPQIEINEVENINLDPNIIAERIANSLEKYGANRFKGVGHKAMEDVMNAGAMGIEILISGKIPSSRAKRWRFYQGYLKKCGDVVLTGVKTAYATAQLKVGTVGIQVRIMPPSTKLPDRISLHVQEEEPAESVTSVEEKKEDKGDKEGKTKDEKNETEKVRESKEPKEKKTKETKERKKKKSNEEKEKSEET